MVKVGDTWICVITAGVASATGCAADTGVRLCCLPNCHCCLDELPGAVLGGTAGNFPFEEEGVGGSSPRRDVVKGYDYGVMPVR